MTVSKLLAGTLMLTLLLAPSSAFAGPTPTIVFIFVVDESGSMATEHDFLDTGGGIPVGIAIPLRDGLAVAGFNDVQFGLVGYGALAAHGTGGHKHLVNGNDLGTAVEFGVAAQSLITSGGTEDGYEAMKFALDNYAIPANSLLQIVLVTDENRDNFGANPITFATINADLMSAGAFLNVIINCSFTEGQTQLLGIVKNNPTNDAALGTEFIEQPNGAFSTQVGDATISNCATSTETDYVDLADLNLGAAWDLNQLRLGGNSADSFSTAFVDIKIEEIKDEATPIGGEILSISSTALLLAGLSANALWLLPMLVGIAGTGAYFTRNIWNKSKE